jgi:type IV pilus assembly protein PilB
MTIDKNIENALIKEGVLTKENLDRVLSEHARTGENLTAIIERLEFATQEDIIKAISKHYEIPYEEITEEYVNPQVITLIKPDLARKFKTIPVNQIAGQLTVAMSDPLNLLALDTLSFTVGKKIKPIICKEETINRLIDRFFPEKKPPEYVPETYAGAGTYYYTSEEEPEQIEANAEAAPIIRLVNLTISQAMKSRASDIHIEGRKKEVVVRFRIDGVLRQISAFPKTIQGSIIARIKVMSGLDIAERIKPQDGRFSVKTATGTEVDFRVSTYTSVTGESAVIRILDQAKSEVDIAQLGFTPKELSAIQNVLARPSGMIIVSGPTGSGKTTTLYAMLNRVISVERKIITIEDPVEYRLDLIDQISINTRRGLTFPSVLRSVLRQDPDVILVGEIRDEETAQIAVQAALTGHLLFSTLHTNSPAEVFGRLRNLGVERYYVSDIIRMVIGQRLIRKLCTNCRAPYDPKTDELLALGFTGEGNKMTFFNPQGCDRCDNTGYKGVTGVFEVMVVDEEIKELLEEDAPTDKINHETRRHGTVTMWQNARRMVSEGIVSFRDIVRVVPKD